jgi:hypothetical protein
MAGIAPVALLVFSLTTPLIPGLRISPASESQGENDRLTRDITCGLQGPYKLIPETWQTDHNILRRGHPEKTGRWIPEDSMHLRTIPFAG